MSNRRSWCLLNFTAVAIFLLAAPPCEGLKPLEDHAVSLLALVDHWIDDGRWSEAVELLAENRDLFTRDGSLPALEAELLVRLGALYWKRGQWSQAEAALTQTLNLAESTDRTALQARALYELGEMAYIEAFLMNRPVRQEAIRLHRDALEIRRQLGDQAGVSRSLSRLAVIQERAKNYVASDALQAEALQTARSARCPSCETRPLTHMGVAARRGEDLQKARSLFQEALRINRSLGLAEPLGFNLVNVALADMQAGESFASCLHLLYEAQEIAERTGFGLLELRVRDGLGQVYEAQGHSRLALEHYQRGLSRAEQLSLTGFTLLLNSHIERVNQSLPTP